MPSAYADERADAGAAAGADGYRVRSRPRDEVRDDQEVALEAHLHDHVELAREPVAIARLVGGADAELAHALFEAALRAAFEVRARRAAVVRREVRQEHAAEIELEAATLRDLDGVRERLGQIGE